MLGVLARNKGLELEVTIAEAVPQAILVDPGHLRQVLINLMGNAVKFTPSGSVRLTVQAHSVDRPGEVGLTFRVADTGIGISEALRPTIFEPFERAQLPDSQRTVGTGLGLAITRRLVTEMGARSIWCRMRGLARSSNYPSRFRSRPNRQPCRRARMNRASGLVRCVACAFSWPRIRRPADWSSRLCWKSAAIRWCRPKMAAWRWSRRRRGLRPRLVRYPDARHDRL